MKPVTRRSVTTGLAAAVTAIPAVRLSVGAESASELPGLIKAHRAAYRAFCNAITRREKMEEAYKDTDVTVPCQLGNSFSLSYGREFCQEHILAAYYGQRERLKPLSRIAPPTRTRIALVIRFAMFSGRLQRRRQFHRLGVSVAATLLAVGILLIAICAERGLDMFEVLEADRAPIILGVLIALIGLGFLCLIAYFTIWAVARFTSR
jgi:hypothetical protein